MAPVSGQEFAQAMRRVVGDAGEDVCEPGLGADVVELGGFDEAVEEGRALAADIGAGENAAGTIRRPSSSLPAAATFRPVRRVAQTMRCS